MFETDGTDVEFLSQFILVVLLRWTPSVFYCQGCDIEYTIFDVQPVPKLRCECRKVLHLENKS